MRYNYPAYAVDLTPEIVAACRDAGQKLLEEVGLKVNHERFVDAIKEHDGVRADGQRVRIDRTLSDRYLDVFIEQNRKELEAAQPPSSDRPWSISCGGYSISVIDIETDEVRPATCRDLRDLIRLAHSLDVTGSYPCAPQDVPPLMRAPACFKICWEESDHIRPFDYLDVRQTPYLYEMHKVMGRPFTIVVNIPHPMTVSEHDIEVFLRYYPMWKRNPNEIAFYAICDYPMLGILKPITSTGSIASYLAQSFGTYILFKLFDPEVEMRPRLSAGSPVDLRNMCWAFGSPRTHLYAFLNARVLPALCGLRPDLYAPLSTVMHTSSCAVDVRAGMEKTATALVGAMQGARAFSGAGNLAVDDLFSGVQLVIDVEIFEYVKELIEAFDPHPDILATENLYEVLYDVGVGREEFYSHMDTATKVRNLLPVSKRRPHEKLRAWMMHKQNIKDRIREECLERIKNQTPFALAEDKRKELDKIYHAAEKELAGREYT